AIVRARFNDAITQGLLDGALQVLRDSGVTDDRIRVVEVPGSFEIIHAANMLASAERYHAIICLGAIIKGATKHDEYLAHAVYDGMKDIAIGHNLPVVAGVLTVNDKAQAEERAGDGPMNRGAEAAHVALEMATLDL
ncbi:6,7-dimethyl-8-ribityllumazine synthase, partial [Candidatus Uhrbacteria bacterium]|nr:6,7-dimethyl-8-ribityllumazine synthase [Candidatus Uhrbacteria bacterium]